MKILHKIPLRQVGSHATVRMGHWRRLDSPKCREAYASASVQTIGQHRPDARSSFPSPSSIWISKKTLIGKVFCNHLDVWATPSGCSLVFQKILVFLYWCGKGITAMTVRTLGQHIWTRSWYGKLSTLFWKGSCSWPSRCSVKPSGRPSVFGGFCARLSIFIITVFSCIGLRRNWCRWKSNKKCYNSNIWKANKNVRIAQRSDGKIKHPDAL